MISIEGIVNEIKLIEDDMAAYTVRLERERGEVTNTMNKAQEAFSDQQAGQQLISALYQVLQDLVDAGSILYLVRAELRDYIREIQK